MVTWTSIVIRVRFIFAVNLGLFVTVILLISFINLSLILCFHDRIKILIDSPGLHDLLKMSIKSPTAQNRRLQVENELDQVKALLAQKPKTLEQIMEWRLKAENWIAKMDVWLADFQVMSSAYLKPRLMSTYKKVNELFVKMEDGTYQQEMDHKGGDLQHEVDSMYYHQMPKHGEYLTNEQFEKMLFSKYNNPDFEENGESKWIL